MQLSFIILWKLVIGERVRKNSYTLIINGFPGGSDSKVSASLDQEDHLEKEAHSSTLAWKIPWTEEPCKLQSTGSQRVGHD